MKISLKKVIALGAVALVGCGLSARSASAAYGTITNDVWKTTTSGTVIYAQSGFIEKFGGTYYWYGVKYNGAVTYVNTGTSNSDTSFVSINCYTSTDLINWNPGTAVVTPSAQILTSDYVGRLGGVLFNAASGKYVMWAVYIGSQGSGEMCLTSSSPAGPFVWDHLQTSITNVFDGRNGDATIMVDHAHGGTPYFITSDAHGRQHAYVCPFSSDYKTINAASLIAVWPSDGQEGNCAFYSTATGQYYYVTSQTNGWSYSTAFQVYSTNILSGYSADAAFTGTVASSTHHAQCSFFFPVVGSSNTVYLFVCDRWADFSSNYKTAGFPNGYYVWQPVSASAAYKNNPTFWDLTTWQLDAAGGNWKD